MKYQVLLLVALFAVPQFIVPQVLAQTNPNSSSSSATSSSSLMESGGADLSFQGFETVTEGSFVGRGDTSTFIGRPVGSSSTAARNTRTTGTASTVRRSTTTSSRTASSRTSLSSRTSSGSREVRSVAALDAQDDLAPSRVPAGFNRAYGVTRSLDRVSESVLVTWDPTSGTAILQGAASPREQRLLEQLLRLEPGVQQVLATPPSPAKSE